MDGDLSWPATAEALVAFQLELARETPAPFDPLARQSIAMGGCAICFAAPASGPGSAGDPAWAAAALVADGRLIETTLVQGAAGASFEPGLLALREGPLLEAAVRALRTRPDLLLVNGTARDHPRRAGMALHLGALLDVPTIGVTRRPLCGEGAQPGSGRGARGPLLLDGECVAHRVRTQAGAQPIVVHGGWRVDAATAVEVVLGACRNARTPEPIRQARRIARTARAESAIAAT